MTLIIIIVQALVVYLICEKYYFQYDCCTFCNLQRITVSICNKLVLVSLYNEYYSHMYVKSGFGVSMIMHIIFNM